MCGAPCQIASCTPWRSSCHGPRTTWTAIPASTLRRTWNRHGFRLKKNTKIGAKWESIHLHLGWFWTTHVPFFIIFVLEKKRGTNLSGHWSSWNGSCMGLLGIYCSYGHGLPCDRRGVCFGVPWQHGRLWGFIMNVMIFVRLPHWKDWTMLLRSPNGHLRWKLFLALTCWCVCPVLKF